MFSIDHTCTCGKCKCTTDSIFVTAKENGRKLTINNKDGSFICIFKLDGCIYNLGEGPSKCDYIFSFKSSDNKKSKFLFVELKGKGVDYAFKQLESALNLYKNKIKEANNKIREANRKDEIKNTNLEAIVVAKKCPRADDTATKKKKDFFAEKYSTKLYMKSDMCTIDHKFV